MKTEWQALIVLTIIILAGSYIRLVHLDVKDFGADELNHYYAAVSIQQGHGPLLPSGNPYLRGIDLTGFVSLSLRLIDDPEKAARLPSALFGILNLIIFGRIAWVLGGGWSAVWATLLLAIYPEAINQSRITRFYTYQLCFGLVALYCGWRVVQREGIYIIPKSIEVCRQWIYAVMTVLAFFLAVRVQVTTLSVLAGWGFALAALGCIDFVLFGPNSWRRSVAIQITGIAGIFSVLLIALFPNTIDKLLASAQHVPAWVGTNPESPFYYYYALSDAFPIVISLAPLIFFAVATKDPRFSLYLLIWFAVPFFLHSFVFKWKGERFILLALPALFLAAGIAAAVGVDFIYRTIHLKLAPLIVRERWIHTGSASITVLVCLFIVVTTSAFNMARKLPMETAKKEEDWSKVGEIIRSASGNGTIPVGSSNPLVGLFYWGNLDFVVGKDFLDTSQVTEKKMRDYYSGALVLPTPEMIKTYFHESKGVLIGIDKNQWSYGNIDVSLKKVLSTEAEELCQGKCGTLNLYRWFF